MLRKKIRNHEQYRSHRRKGASFKFWERDLPTPVLPTRAHALMLQVDNETASARYSEYYTVSLNPSFPFFVVFETIRLTTSVSEKDCFRRNPPFSGRSLLPHIPMLICQEKAKSDSSVYRTHISSMQWRRGIVQWRGVCGGVESAEVRDAS